MLSRKIHGVNIDIGVQIMRHHSSHFDHLTAFLSGDSPPFRSALPIASPKSLVRERMP